MRKLFSSILLCGALILASRTVNAQVVLSGSHNICRFDYIDPSWAGPSDHKAFYWSFPGGDDTSHFGNEGFPIKYSTDTGKLMITLRIYDSATTTWTVYKDSIHVAPVPNVFTITSVGPQCVATGAVLSAYATDADSYLWSSGCTSDKFTAMANGYYSVSVTLGACSVNLGTTVALNPSPTAPAVAVTDCHIALTSVPSDISSVHWLHNDVTIPGATDVSYDATAPGDYSAIVTNTLSCYDETNKQTLTCGSLAVSSAISSPVNYAAYPNPAIDRLTLNLDNANYRIQLTDMLGHRYEQPATGTTEISLGNFASGVYMLNVLKDGVIVNHQKISKF